MLKFCGIALLCAAAASLLQGTKSPLYTFLPLLGGICITIYAFGRLGETLSPLRSMSENTEMSGYAGTLLRALGIGYAAELTADVCRGCGAERSASAILLLGRAELVLLACPLLVRLLDSALSVLS